MAEKEFVLFDGVQHIKISAEEKYSTNGLPTGHYRETGQERETISIYGAFLDQQENRDKLKDDVYAIAKGGKYNPLDYNYILQADNKVFLLAQYSAKMPKEGMASLFDGILYTILSLGYVHKPYTVYEEERYIAIPLQLKESGKETILYFIPFDNRCYKIPYES